MAYCTVAGPVVSPPERVTVSDTEPVSSSFQYAVGLKAMVEPVFTACVTEPVEPRYVALPA